jgi:DnaJ-class molecular chaperone
MQIFENGLIPIYQKDAERAYKLLAQEHHPDKGGNSARMSEINQAIEEARKESEGNHG